MLSPIHADTFSGSHFPSRTAKETPLARRVIQFPVRNAFTAERSRNSLARDAQERDTQDQAHRIAARMESEISRLAERHATGNRAAFEASRNREVVVLRPTSRVSRLRKRIAAMPVAARDFASRLFTRPD
jgi:hypothetical protein